MPYIIAEPCINVKDRSCVDVCPVDCIYEGPRVRTGVPRDGDLPRGRHPAAMEGLHREESRHLPKRKPARQTAAQRLLTQS